MSFGLPKNATVSLNVYDLAGNKVADLVHARFRPGFHRASWNGTDLSGQRLASGIYFAVFTAGTFSATEKVILIR
jgi:hypothetical protein